MSHATHNTINLNIVGVHYRVGRKIGEGSFGVIHEGTNLANNQTVAIKFESRKCDAPQLRDECRAYKILLGCHGIPQIYHFGTESLYHVLVIDLLGPSMEDLFDACGRKFSIKTVCMAARQMITRVQTIHEKNLIYRDIKPDNFLIGRLGTRSANIVHVVDFGMAKQYRDPKTMQHIPYRERKSLSGTARYMSINTHLGREQSRRDDLEALGHVFMYFLRGSLPWQGLKAATNKQKYEKIGEKKQTTTIKELCDGYPPEFAIYLNYVRKLGFEETPDYDFLRDLFKKVMKNTGDADDGVYDWMLLNNGKGLEASGAQSSNGHQSSGHRHRPEHPSRRVSQSQQPGNGSVVPPSPALVRHGSKGKAPYLMQQNGGMISAGTTPNSAAAQVGVPVGRRASMQQQQAQHPYATGAAAFMSAEYNGSGGLGVGGGPNGHARGQTDGYANGQPPYGRTSPMVSSVGAATPPALTNVRARGTHAGVSNGEYDQYEEDLHHQQSPSVWRILTCRC